LIEEDVQPTNLAVKLLRIHHRMGHAGNGQARSSANATQKLPCTNVRCLYVRQSKQKGMEEQGNEGATS
jgi:hypothetical protein